MPCSAEPLWTQQTCHSLSNLYQSEEGTSFTTLSPPHPQGFIRRRKASKGYGALDICTLKPQSLRRPPPQLVPQQQHKQQHFKAVQGPQETGHNQGSRVPSYSTLSQSLRESAGHWRGQTLRSWEPGTPGAGQASSSSQRLQFPTDAILPPSSSSPEGCACLQESIWYIALNRGYLLHGTF